MRLLALFTAILFTFPLLAQNPREEPSTQPTEGQGLIQASDEKTLKEKVGQEVLVEGIVKSAEWSSTGKVMNIEFNDSTLLAVVFDRRRAAMDEAFAGDFAKAITGKTIRVKGRLEEYGGRVESMKGRPQIIINNPYQVTIMPEET